MANILITGSAEGGARHMQEMLQSMGKAGIKPTVKSFDALTEQLGYMHRMTGMTTEQYRVMFNQLSENSDVRQRLQSLDKNQRRLALQGIMLRIAENEALGMLPEQAIKAAEALAGIAGGGPKERYKQAALLQMAAGALGISGAGEAAEALRMGDRASDSQKATLQRVLIDLANAQSDSRTASVGMEFAVERLLKDLPQVQKDSVFNTRLAETLMPDPDVAKNIKTTAEQGGVVNTALISIALTTKAIHGILSNSALGAGAAALASTAAFLGRRKIASGAKGLWNSMRGGGGGPGAGGQQSFQFGKNAMKVGKVAKAVGRGSVIGGAVMGVKDLYDLSQGDTSGANTGALVGTAVGALIGGALGSIIPGAGTVLGAGLGASVGNMAGEWIGGNFDDPKSPQAALANNTAELVTPIRRTADTTDAILAANIHGNELLELQIKQTAGIISNNEQRTRLAALNDSTQYLGWNKADA